MAPVRITCRYCGTENHSRATRCHHCGDSFNVFTDEKARIFNAEGHTVITPEQKTAPVKKNVNWKPIVPRLVVYLFLALALSYSIYNMPPYVPMVINTPKPAEYPEETGYYLDYRYSMKRIENRTVALFQPKMLPRIDSVLIDATQHIIQKSYGEKATAKPVLVDYQFQGQPVKGIKFFSKQNTYMLIFIKEDTGEAHTLIIDKL